MEKIILGIDVGTKSSGIIILRDGKIEKGDNLDNESMFSLIDKYSLFDVPGQLTVVYEDMRPYASRFNMDTINTCKVIGRLEYVLKQQRIDFTGISRNEVKAYVFNCYPDIVIPEVQKRIDYGLLRSRMKLKKDGSEPVPKFIYVNDRMVYKAMMEEWKIPKPKAYKGNIYGIKSHAWQALGVVSCYLKKLSFDLQGTHGTY